MELSARDLGREYGLSAEAMNAFLKKIGILEGEPGDYNLTAIGRKFGIEKDFHRGTGGYSQYNRYWTTRSYDESIKSFIEPLLSPEMKEEIISELNAAHAARYAAQAAARAKAEQAFLARQAAKLAEEEAERLAQMKAEQLSNTIQRIGKGCAIVGASALLGYGIYKAYPAVQSWIANKKNPSEMQGEEIQREPDSVPLKIEKMCDANTK